jgi:hypothetical protein
MPEGCGRVLLRLGLAYLLELTAMLDRSCQIVRVVLWTISLACLVLLVAGVSVSLLAIQNTARGAPIPFARKDVPLRHPAFYFTGDWDMEWQGYRAKVSFAAEGGYKCTWCGQPWIGNWRVEEIPASGEKTATWKLIVTETCQPPNPNALPTWYTWEATVEPGKRKGKVNLGGVFSLSALKKAKPDF